MRLRWLLKAVLKGVFPELTWCMVVVFVQVAMLGDPLPGHPIPFYLSNRFCLAVGLLGFYLIAVSVGRSSWREDRDAERARLGLCRRCGYDLRASPGRCPECGASTGKSN